MNRFLTLVVAVAGTNYHPQLTPYEPAGTRAVEFGTALGDSGYAKLEAALPWKPGPIRQDDYYDAWDGHRFLLQNGQATLKVRIKLKARHRDYWQVSRYVSRDRLALDDIGVKIHVTETWEGKLKQAQDLLTATDLFFERLDAGGKPLSEAADRVDLAYRQLRKAEAVPGANVLDGYLQGKRYKFYPLRRSVAKSRVEAALPGFQGPRVRLLLGSSPELDAKGKTVMLHELEAEPDGTLTPAQTQEAATAIAKLLERAGVGPKDLERPEAEGSRYVASKLEGR